ncbi:hypothetical protein KKD20_01355 [Patescibacteria group bacterium]|nr:hypothetical protein [Patescibacteria group bacterium]
MSITYSRIKDFFKRRPYRTYIVLFTVSFLIFTWLQATPTLADPDSFYHIKVAMLMQEKLEQGEWPIFKGFPWLYHTTLRQNFADHHLIYHLLMTPLMNYLDPITSSKFLTVILDAALITFLFWLLKRFKIKRPLALTALLYTSAGFIFRISLIKAQPLALIMFFLSLYVILKRKYWLMFLVAFLYVWTYGGWILMLFIGGSYVLAEVIQQMLASSKRNLLSLLRCFFVSTFAWPHIKLMLIILAGIAAGIIINPYFPENLNFYWIQIFQIAVVNKKGAINLGAEWYAPNFSDFLLQNILILVLWVIACAWFLYNIKLQARKNWTLFLLSGLFLILALRSSKQIEYFAPLALMFSGFSFAVNPFSSQRFNWQDLLARIKKFFIFPNPLTTILISGYVITAIFICGVSFTAQLTSVRTSLNKNFALYYLQNASAWLEKNTPKNSIVFHTCWDESPMLFFHNHHNYYLVGLDPTFMYAYDSYLYELHRDITSGKDTIGLAYKIKTWFNSEYVILTKKRYGDFEKVLKHQDGFESVYEDEEAHIFRIVN